MADFTNKDLSEYRLNKAFDTLASARRELEAGDFASANNRAYYALFHAMRAALAINRQDFKKHSAVISEFSKQYLKTEIFDKKYSKLISKSSLIRNQSDYEDFYICSVEDTNKLVDEVEEFVNIISEYIKKYFDK